MASLRTWLQAARPLAQANLAVPLLYGEMLAFAGTGQIHWGPLVAAHAFAIADHLFIVFANDLADEEGDRHNATFNRFSGGSRVLVEGKLDRRRLRRAAIVSGVALAGICAAIAALWSRPLALGAGATALILLWAYSYPPLRLAYRGHGEWLQGLGTGLVLPALGFYLQAAPGTPLPWPALVAPVLLGVAGNILTSLPDRPADESVDKRSVPVRIGARPAQRRILQLVVLAALLAPLALPDATRAELVGVELPPLAFAAGAALLGRHDDAHDRTRCLRFIWLVGIAINLTLVSLCIALALG